MHGKSVCHLRRGLSDAPMVFVNEHYTTFLEKFQQIYGGFYGKKRN